MRVAINIIPLNTDHKYRGIGYYTNGLIKALKNYENIEIQEFTNISEVQSADVIHYPWFDFFFHTLPKIKHTPMVVTIHDVIPLKFSDHYPMGIKGKINFFLQKLALKKSSAIITDSNSSKNDIAKFLKVKKDKVFVIPLAADEDFKILPDADLIRVRRKYSLSDQFLLYAGDANWVKNVPFLIEAFKKMSANPICSNLKLVLVGGVFLKNVDDIDHPELASLKEVNNLIKKYDLESNVIKVGNIEKKELAAFYNLATVYVQPSFYEGFGLPVLEAMSCGTPVVSSSGGSLLEVGGKAAVYFDPNDLKQFESIIIKILENKPLQGKLSRLGVSQAEKFSWKNTASKTLQVYSNVIKL